MEQGGAAREKKEMNWVTVAAATRHTAAARGKREKRRLHGARVVLQTTGKKTAFILAGTLFLFFSSDHRPLHVLTDGGAAPAHCIVFFFFFSPLALAGVREAKLVYVGGGVLASSKTHQRDPSPPARQQTPHGRTSVLRLLLRRSSSCLLESSQLASCTTTACAMSMLVLFCRLSALGSRERQSFVAVAVPRRGRWTGKREKKEEGKQSRSNKTKVSAVTQRGRGVRRQCQERLVEKERGKGRV